MLKERLPLLFFCLMCMVGLFVMQLYWLNKIYGATQENFEKEISLALETSVNEAFDKRCSYLEQQISNKLMDTALFTILARKDDKGYYYRIANAKNVKDVSNGLSLSSLNIPVIPGDTANRRVIANGIAQMIRISDLQTHTIYYRTQQLGNLVDSLVENSDFNQNDLMDIYNRNLISRNIHIPYKLFYTSDSKILPRLTREDSYSTKSFLIYGNKNKKPYVSAKFSNPFPYIATNMALGFICSVLLVICIAICLLHLLKTLFKEKKLADMKNDFISNITHEFKTPIATISVAVEALTSFDVLQDEKKTHRYLGHAKTELTRLSGLVDQILALAFYHNENIILHKEMVDLKLALNELTELQKISTTKIVNVAIEPDQFNYQLHVNKIQFYHALNNVLENAIKYSDNVVEIKIKVTVDTGFLLICISDNGYGIMPEDLPFIFDQFYRSPSIVNKELKGYGLGLNYVKYIMEKHGGWYKVNSVIDKGSSFILAWPL